MNIFLNVDRCGWVYNYKMNLVLAVPVVRLSCPLAEPYPQRHIFSYKTIVLKATTKIAEIKNDLTKSVLIASSAQVSHGCIRMAIVQWT